MGEASRRRDAGIAARRRAQSYPPLVVKDRRPAHKPDKGLKGGSCNREACQAPGATWYNRSTRAYYCRRCAHWLNTDTFNKRDAERLYGGLLCVEET